MVDLNKMSRTELAAAMKGGTEAWGVIGSAERNVRYILERPKAPGRKRKCHCGCGMPVTHSGMANGVCLTGGCELSMRRWVKNG